MLRRIAFHDDNGLIAMGGSALALLSLSSEFEYLNTKKKRVTLLLPENFMKFLELVNLLRLIILSKYVGGVIEC